MRQHDWGIVTPLGIVPADRTQNIPIIAAGDTTIVHCPFSIPQSPPCVKGGVSEADGGIATSLGIVLADRIDTPCHCEERSDVAIRNPKKHRTTPGIPKGEAAETLGLLLSNPLPLWAA